MLDTHLKNKGGIIVKKFVFDVEDNVTRRVSVIAGNVEEARQKLNDWNIEDEYELQGDMDTPNAELMYEEELDD